MPSLARDGFVIVKLEKDSETWLIWIRTSPITDRALRLFKRITERHKYDRLVLLKEDARADYVTFKELEDAKIVVVSVGELLKQQ